MRILIENAETSEFLTAQDEWTHDAKRATTYATTTSAKEHGSAAKIGKFNVIGIFANSSQITNLDDGCGTAG